MCLTALYCMLWHLFSPTGSQALRHESPAGRGGRGRHSFVFSRSTGQLSWLGFQIFCSVPFLYELRQILDWSCTPTTLKLFDWLKLEVP